MMRKGFGSIVGAETAADATAQDAERLQKDNGSKSPEKSSIFSDELRARLAKASDQQPGAYRHLLRSNAEILRRSERFQDRVAIFRALSDETRLLICALLKRQYPMTATEIQVALELTHATVSHHMTTLHESGLVKKERRGRWAVYTPETSLFPLFP